MKKAVSLIMVLLSIMSLCTFSALAVDEREFSNEYYHSRFQKTFKRLDAFDDYFEFEEYYCSYNELMVCKNNNTVNYTLVFPKQDASPREGYAQVGKNVITFSNIYAPYAIGLYVYVPSHDEVYTLTEAYDMDIAEISCVFDYLTEKGDCAVAGDTDMDNAITIKDATMIQKQIAGLVSEHPFEAEGVDYLLYYGIKDFNMDEEINIKDATAIQKYVAGIIEDKI